MMKVKQTEITLDESRSDRFEKDNTTSYRNNSIVQFVVLVPFAVHLKTLIKYDFAMDNVVHSHQFIVFKTKYAMEWSSGSP